MTSPTSLSTSAILDRLQEIRTSRIRVPTEVSQLGQQLALTNWLTRDTDQAWIVKEQIAFSAIESGQLSLASALIDALVKKYPESPRIIALKGALLEGQGELKQAREWYESRLKEKETDIVIRKRLITLHLSTPIPSPLNPTSTSNESSGLSREKGISLLTTHLDTSYVDAEAWLLLSRSYSELGLFDQAAISLNHAVLLQPQNPFILLQHAELEFTRGEFETGLKEFLRVIEMSTELDKGKGGGLMGCGRRAALGARMCISRLRGKGKSQMGQDVLDRLELVLIEQVLKGYRGKREGEGEELRVMREWLATR